MKIEKMLLDLIDAGGHTAMEIIETYQNSEKMQSDAAELCQRAALWQKPTSAPKTGEIIIADMGWTRPVTACWNDYEQKWVYPIMQINTVDGTDDAYFENEYEGDECMRGWMHLPEFNT